MKMEFPILILVLLALLTFPVCVHGAVRKYTFNVSPHQCYHHILSILGLKSKTNEWVFSVNLLLKKKVVKRNYLKLQVVTKQVTRLCSTKQIVTVNGKFPGPTIYANEDDTILVNVVNNVKYNVSIHW